jgi:16S rRNA (guanine527-N7)-methyltransferase
MDVAIWFRTICRKNGLPVSDSQMAKLQEYVSSLLDWNKKINLISRRDEEGIWERHILVSVALLFKFDLVPDSSIVDMGTGGGLPGIPLGILGDRLTVTLIDSIQKKIRAVSEIISTLKLENIKAVPGRIEELSKSAPHRNSYDYVIARGVGSITEIVSWGSPLLKRQSAGTGPERLDATKSLDRGAIILLKGGDLTQEVEQARVKLKPREVTSYPLVIEGIDPTHLFDKKIVIVRP